MIAFGTRAHVYVREGVYARAFVRPCVRVCMDGYVGVDMGVVTRAMVVVVVTWAMVVRLVYSSRAKLLLAGPRGFQPRRI